MAQLFKAYEVVRVPYWPKLARIVIPSVILHTAFLVAVAYVPAIQNAFHLTKMMSNLKVGDHDYVKTKIGDSSNVQVVNLATDDVFRYPDGYFATEPPPPNPLDPVVVVQPTPMPMPPPVPAPVIPKPVMPPMARNRMPKPPLSVPQPSPTPGPITGDPQQANQAADKVAQTYGIKRPHDEEINRKPLKDFVAMANSLYDEGKLNFNNPVEVVIDADLDESAHLVNPVIVSKTGDGPLENIATEMVAALSDSNALRMFITENGDQQLRKVRFIIKIDQNQFAAQVESEAPDATQAKKMANGYGLLLAAVPILRPGKDDEIAIAKGTTVRADGKKLIANFAMPRQQAIDLMKKQVAANAKPES